MPHTRGGVALIACRLIAACNGRLNELPDAASLKGAADPD